MKGSVDRRPLRAIDPRLPRQPSRRGEERVGERYGTHRDVQTVQARVQRVAGELYDEAIREGANTGRRARRHTETDIDVHRHIERGDREGGDDEL